MLLWTCKRCWDKNKKNENIEQIIIIKPTSLFSCIFSAIWIINLVYYKVLLFSMFIDAQVSHKHIVLLPLPGVYLMFESVSNINHFNIAMSSTALWVTVLSVSSEFSARVSSLLQNNCWQPCFGTRLTMEAVTSGHYKGIESQL